MIEITDEMMELSVDDIRPNPYQPRKFFDEEKLRILATSIQEVGIKDTVKLVWKPGDDGKKTTIRDGERRIRASRIAGKKILKYGTDYIFVEDTDKDLQMNSLIAFCMREGLSPGEKGDALYSLLKKRGLKKIDVAVSAVSRAKDFTDNDFLADPSRRNYFISKEIIKEIAADMKKIGMSGTNAIDLLKLIKLPKDIKHRVVFAPPNTKLQKPISKRGRLGNSLICLDEKSLNKLPIPVAHARELARVKDVKIIRFLLKKAFINKWSSKKLNNMVNDYIESHMTPDNYIEAFNVSARTLRQVSSRTEELSTMITAMDRFSSSIDSFRVINLVAMSTEFKRRQLVISGKGLLKSTINLKACLEKMLFNTKQMIKVQEENRVEVENTSFRVTVNKQTGRKQEFRFSVPIAITRKLNIEDKNELEISVKSLIKRENAQD